MILNFEKSLVGASTSLSPREEATSLSPREEAATRVAVVSASLNHR